MNHEEEIRQLKQVVAQLEARQEEMYGNWVLYELGKPVVTEAIFAAVQQWSGLTKRELTQKPAVKPQRKTQLEKNRDVHVDNARLWLLSLINQLTFAGRADIERVLHWSNHRYYYASRGLITEMQADLSHPDRPTWRALLELVWQKCREIRADTRAVEEELESFK